LIQRRFAPFVTFESSDLWHRHFMRAKQHSEKQNCELVLKRADGSVFHAQLDSRHMESGSLFSVRIVLSDITERKRMEYEIQERRYKMAELHTLHVAAQTAAAIAHELNQPLLAIASYSQAALMLMKAANPNLDRISTALEGCERQALRAGKTIHELIEFLSNGEFPTETFDLGEEIRNILNAARMEHELQFEFVFREGEEIPPVKANRAHVQKVLFNLLHNGVEAMQEASVALPAFSVSVRTNQDENVAQVTIQDNGPGINKADIQHLFEPFFTTKAEGNGMGLAISRSLIEENGGRLWADPQDSDQFWLDPEDRCGATFHLTLPFAS
jgi:two-component system, LuxR family, sensor kinase FixL